VPRLDVESVRLATDAVESTQDTETQPAVVLVLPDDDASWGLCIVHCDPVAPILSKAPLIGRAFVNATPLVLVSRFPSEFDEHGGGDLSPWSEDDGASERGGE
jgi:hypothetical protein